MYHLIVYLLPPLKSYDPVTNLLMIECQHGWFSEFQFIAVWVQYIHYNSTYVYLQLFVLTSVKFAGRAEDEYCNHTSLNTNLQAITYYILHADRM